MGENEGQKVDGSAEQSEAQTGVRLSLLDIAVAEEQGLIKKDANNLRLHDKRNREATEASVEEVGYGRSIATAEDGTIFAGNNMFDTAKKRGGKLLIVEVDDPDTLVDVRRTHIKDEQTKIRAGLHDNRASELGKWDKKAMSRLVTEHPEQKLLAGVFTPREQERLLTAQANALDLADGGMDDGAPAGATVAGSPAKQVNRPESTVRMVSIYLTTDEGSLNHQEFVRRVRLLSQVIKTEDGQTPANITDTVAAVVARAFKEWVPQTEEKTASADADAQVSQPVPDSALAAV